MMIWPHSRGNPGRFTASGGGIPNAEPAWTSKSIPFMAHQNLCMTATEIFVMGMENVVALAASDGSELWRTALPCGAEGHGLGMVLADAGLYAWGYLLRPSDGEIIEDYTSRPRAPIKAIDDSHLSTGGLVRSLEDGSQCRFGPNGEVQYYEFDLTRAKVDDSGRFLLGWHGRDFVCVDIESGAQRWAHTLLDEGIHPASANFGSANGEVIVSQVAGHIWRLNTETGETSGQSLSIFAADQLNRVHQVVCAPDMVYVTGERDGEAFLRACDRDSADLVFEQQVQGLSLLFSYDDMLVGMLENGAFKIWDRYSGDELHRGAGAVRPSNLAGCYGNLVAHNRESSLLFFKSAEPYSSPHK